MRTAAMNLDWTCGDETLDQIVHEQLLLVAEAFGVDPSRVTRAIGARSADSAGFAKSLAASVD